MSPVFDGKKFALEKEKIITGKVKSLKITPKMVSILIGNNKASLLYSNLKQKSAQKVGMKFIIKKFKEDENPQTIISYIKELNKDKKVHGIMVQLPLPPNFKKFKLKILNSIAKQKDVDGLTKSSPFTPATVKAVEEILNFATKDLSYFGKKAAVIGARGFVGKRVAKMLEDLKYKVVRCDKDTRDLYAKITNTDLVVSATGVPDLIKGEMVKEGCIAIDVGAPTGDFDKKVLERASFATPVPGGVGPVTITCLLENLLEAIS